MLCGDGLVRSLGLFFGVEGDGDCLGVGISTVEGSTEVCEEG